MKDTLYVLIWIPKNLPSLTAASVFEDDNVPFRKISPKLRQGQTSRDYEELSAAWERLFYKPNHS